MLSSGGLPTTDIVAHSTLTNPLAPADIEHKFRHVVSSCVDSGRAERIVQLVRELDRLDTTRELIGLVAAPVEM